MTQEDPPRLRKLNRHVPPDLETIVHKTIAREPNQRYTTAQAVVEDLNRFLEGRPILARRVSTAEQAWRWCKRNPWLSGAIATAALALVAASVVSLVYAAEQARARQADFGAGRQSQVGARPVERALRQARRLRSASREQRMTALQFEQAQVALEKGEIPQGLLRLVECWKSAVAAGDADWQHTARMNLAAWQRQLLPPRPLFNAGAAPLNGGVVVLSDDGTRLLSGSTASFNNSVTELQLWEVATGKPLGPRIGFTLDRNHYAAFAARPDASAFLLTVSIHGEMDETRLVDAASGQFLGPPLALPSESHRATALAPDGKTAAIAAGQSFTLWDSISGRRLDAPPESKLAAWIDVLIFSPDGKTLLAGRRGDESRLFDVATGRPKGAAIQHRRQVLDAAFSPDGKLLALACGQRSILARETAEARLFDAMTGLPVGPALPVTNVEKVLFSPDGKTLVTSTGSWFFMSSGEARLWDVATGKPVSPALCIRAASPRSGFGPMARPY